LTLDARSAVKGEKDKNAAKRRANKMKNPRRKINKRVNSKTRRKDSAKRRK
jgi:hypothetical protein